MTSYERLAFMGLAGLWIGACIVWSVLEHGQTIWTAQMGMGVIGASALMSIARRVT